MVAAALALSALVGACSGSSNNSSSSSTASATTTTPPASTSTSTTITPRTTTSSTTTTSTVVDAATVTPIAQKLIDAYDAAVAAILADPRVAIDPKSPLVTAYLALFPDGSTFAKGTVEFWASEGAAGRFYRPGPRAKMSSSTVQSVELRSATEAAAKVCTVTSIQVVDTSGNKLESQGGVTGVQAVITFAGGRWLLGDLTQGTPAGCPAVGSGA
jgi:hypothetical protein